jgi:beta-xylosidase
MEALAGVRLADCCRNPILRGFYPDPSILRVGEDYYLINSSFVYVPALPVSHSRDLIHWQLVHSSIDHYIRGQHGTPYKYFRLALICNLADKESLFGCSMAVVPRDTNNLR